MYLKKSVSDFCYFAVFPSYDNLKLKMTLLILNLYINRHKMGTVYTLTANTQYFRNSTVIFFFFFFYSRVKTLQMIVGKAGKNTLQNT